MNEDEIELIQCTTESDKGGDVMEAFDIVVNEWDKTTTNSYKDGTESNMNAEGLNKNAAELINGTKVVGCCSIVATFVGNE